MGRRSNLEDADLVAKLSGVFRDIGYEGTTLVALARASGLEKASLYHRYPEGKEQMAREVLTEAGRWLQDNVFEPLQSDAPPAQRIANLVRRLDEFYAGGRTACLLNMFSTAPQSEGPFSELIRQVFDAWNTTLSGALIDAGFDKKTATARAERAMILLQGSLVCSRGMGTTRPFRDMLKSLPHELLGPAS